VAVAHPARLARDTSATVVAGIAATSSYAHMVHVALRYGERPEVARVLPISVDGMMIVATAVMLEDQRAGRRARWSARVAFVLGVGASIAANIAAAHPTAGARVVAAWPALALLLVVEMLARPTRRAGRSGAISTVTDEVTSGITSGPVDAQPAGCALPGVPAKPAKAANRKSTGRPERPRTVKTAAPPAARPEPEPDRESPNSSPRQRARRPAAETRQLATAILAEQPHLSRAQVAAQLGVSRQWLYELLATPEADSGQRDSDAGAPSSRVEARR
jgi:hypothetical protein